MYTAPSKLETNFCRVLAQCNKFVSDGKVNEWRLESYVRSLEIMLCDLKENPSRPKEDMLKGYAKQVEFLKGLLRTSKLSSASDKAMASQLLSPGSSTTKNQKVTKELHMKTTEKYTNEMRNELFEVDGLRHRNAFEPVDNDHDVILKYHQNMQEKIAEEMVSLARNLKENSLLAGSIIRKDIEVIDKSSKLADQNYDRLKVESNRLEVHTRKGCNWWIWIMMLVVCMVFLFMVFFMKLFKKS